MRSDDSLVRCVDVAMRGLKYTSAAAVSAHAACLHVEQILLVGCIEVALAHTFHALGGCIRATARFVHKLYY
eukprot:6213252-Pleurochrysis_carterae.AAC.1